MAAQAVRSSPHSTRAPAAKEMKFACAAKGSALLRYVGRLPQCHKSESKVTISKTHELDACVKLRGGSIRLSPPAKCPPAKQPTQIAIKLPGPKQQWFCAKRSNGNLRWVNTRTHCARSERPVWVPRGSPQQQPGGPVQNQPPTVAVDRAPTDISLSKSSVDENQPAGTAVGTLSATDPDSSDTQTYSLVSGTGDGDNGSFQIDGDKLKTAKSFDFETKASYSIRVRADDGHGGTFEKQFTITVNDVNDAPTDISLSNSSVDENQPSGTTVGTLSSSDQDAGDTHTYTLVSGDGSGDNGSFSITGSTLKTAASFDFETKDSYSIRVQADDGHGGTFEKKFTITVGDVNDAPVAHDDSFSGAIANTTFVYDGPAPGTPSTTGPDKVDTTGTVLGNDTDQDSGQSLQVQPAANVPTADGGTVDIDRDGSFVYHPKAGESCQDTQDSFDYTVTDGNSTKPPGTAATDTGTITINFASNTCTWYIDGSKATNGDGTSSSPFNSLAPVNNSASDADSAGDTLFLYPGTYANGLTLEDNEKLLTKRNGLTLASTTLESPASGTDQINGGLVLASGNNVQGLDLGDTASGGTALAASGNVGTVHMDDTTAGSINNTAGGAADISGGGTLNMTFSSVSSSGGANGIRLRNTSGTFTANGGTLKNATNADIDLNGGGTVDFTYGGGITDSAGTAVSMSGQSGGTKLISGNVAAAGAAVSLSGNTGATMNFTGGLSAGSFSASGGGTVSVTDPNGAGSAPDNVLSSGAATALNVANTSIGDNDLNFKSISSSGANPGINLNNTSNTNGKLVVTGSGTANSGGTIENSGGNNITLANVPGGVSLSRMAIHGAADDGVHGTSVAGFSIDNSTIDSNGDGTYGSGDGDRGFDFTDLTGTNSFTSDAVSGNETDGLAIRETTGNSSTTVTGGTYNINAQNDGIREVVNASTGGTHSLDVENSTFSMNNGDSVQMNNDSSGASAATANLTVNNTKSSSAVVATGTPSPILGGGITGSTSANGLLNANITSNTITGAGASPVNLTVHGPGDQINGTITGNTIRSNSADGIQIDSTGASGTPHLNTLIANNTITGSPQGTANGYKTAGIELSSSGSTIMNGTLTNNLVRDPRSTALNGILAEAGDNGSTDTGTLCLDLGSSTNPALKNDATGGSPPASGETDIRLIQRGNDTFKLPGYGGADDSTTDVNAYVSARNLGTAGSSWNAAPGFIGASSCTLP